MFVDLSLYHFKNYTTKYYIYIQGSHDRIGTRGMGSMVIDSIRILESGSTMPYRGILLPLFLGQG